MLLFLYLYFVFLRGIFADALVFIFVLCISSRYLRRCSCFYICILYFFEVSSQMLLFLYLYFVFLRTIFADALVFIFVLCISSRYLRRCSCFYICILYFFKVSSQMLLFLYLYFVFLRGIFADPC